VRNDEVHDPLFGTEVAETLRSFSLEEDPLRRAEHLRARLGPELGRRAAQLLHLRLRTRGRFDAGWLPFLTPKGAEQATAQRLAEARAREILECRGSSQIWDATCGLGADSRAAAEAGHLVLATDADSCVLPYARANLADLAASALVARARVERPPTRAAIVLIDPDRRPLGIRERDPARWSPSWEVALDIADRFEGACVKLSPSFEVGRVAPGPPRRWTWISLRGELHELALWSGELAGPPRQAGREAWRLDADGTRAVLRGEPFPAAPLAPARARSVAWLSEPDPALVRSGLLGVLAGELGLATLDPHLAFLGSDRDPLSPWLRSWRVLGCVPLDRRHVRALLAAHGVGPLSVIKRGHPDDPSTLARRYRGAGDRPGLLAVARLAGGHVAYLLEPQGAAGS